MKKFLLKVLIFIVVIGCLFLIGSREMRRRGINQKDMSIDDLRDIYEANMIGSVKSVDISIFEENPKDASSY